MPSHEKQSYKCTVLVFACKSIYTQKVANNMPQRHVQQENRGNEQPGILFVCARFATYTKTNLKIQVQADLINNSSC